MKLRSSGLKTNSLSVFVVSRIKDAGTPRAFETFCNLSTRANI